MASRAKKKRKSQGREPKSDPPPPDASSWAGEEGFDLSPRQERWLEWFFGVIVFFGAGAFGGAELGSALFGELRGMIIAAGVCGAIGVCLAVVLIRRGEKLF